MKKVNLLSKAEMKQVIGGTDPLGGYSMHCRDKNSELVNPVFDVTSCDFDAYCSAYPGYDRAHSNCNQW